MGAAPALRWGWMIASGELIGLSLHHGVATVKLVRHPDLGDDDLARLFENATQGVSTLFPVLGAVLVDFSMGPNALGTGLNLALGQFFSRLEMLGVPFAFVATPTPLGKLHGSRLVLDFAPNTGGAFTDEPEARRALSTRVRPAGTFAPRASMSWDPPVHTASDSNRGSLGFADPNRGKTGPHPFGDPNRGKTGPNPFGDPNRGKTSPNPFGDPNRGKTGPNPLSEAPRTTSRPIDRREETAPMGLPVRRPSDPKFKL